MAVVFSHTGSPKNKTTAQKEAIDHLRSHRLSLVSGGGCFCAFSTAAGAAEDESDTCFGSPVSDASVSVGAAMLRLKGCQSCTLSDVAPWYASVRLSTRPNILMALLISQSVHITMSRCPFFFHQFLGSLIFQFFYPASQSDNILSSKYTYENAARSTSPNSL
jgi:hypothetical protein